MPELVTGAALDADALGALRRAERLIELRVVRVGRRRRRRPKGPERFRRGAFRGTQARRRHARGDRAARRRSRAYGSPAARVELEDRDDGAYGTFRVSRTRDGDELLELARDGAYRAASAVFEPIPEATQRRRRRHRAISACASCASGSSSEAPIRAPRYSP